MTTIELAPVGLGTATAGAAVGAEWTTGAAEDGGIGGGAETT
jgi:hypothetical protein